MRDAARVVAAVRHARVHGIADRRSTGASARRPATRRAPDHRKRAAASVEDGRQRARRTRTRTTGTRSRRAPDARPRRAERTPIPAPFSDYRAARRVFIRACRRASVHDATVHDLRHTFAVHAAQAGVPIPRMQKLLGHATVAMAMRYMKHAPEAYFAEDAARVGGSLTGARGQ